jgi:hypothetical protein
MVCLRVVDSCWSIRFILLGQGLTWFGEGRGTDEIPLVQNLRGVDPIHPLKSLALTEGPRL